MLNYVSLTQQQYVDLLVNLISSAEGFKPTVYQRGNDNTTIGYGYTFVRSNNLQLWQNAGITLTADEITLLQSIDAAQTRSQKNSLALQFTRSISQTEANNLLRQTYPEFEGPANTLLMPASPERAAFVAITYNRGEGNVNSRMQDFFTAIRNQNRAEAWFELRYNSWGIDVSVEAGLRAARLVESQIFGLYDNPASVAASESQQVYAMLQAHRAKIYKDESRWGVNPDGTTGTTRNLITEVNADTARWGSFLPVDTLKGAVTPARDAFIAWVNTQLPSGATALNPADWNSAAIYFGGPAPGFVGPPAGATLDARPDDGKGGGMANNLLVGGLSPDHLYGGAGDDVLLGQQGNDTLEDGKDNDLLMGGDGFDTYIYNINDNLDTISDSDRRGSILYDNHLVEGGVHKATDLPNTYTSSDGTFTFVWDGVAGHDLTINNLITVKDFTVGELGIRLVDESSLPTGTPVIDYNNGFPTYTQNDGEGDDVDIILTETNDIVHGNGGNDLIITRHGNDQLFGDAGNDSLYAFVGHDQLFGGDGSDLLVADFRDDYQPPSGPVAGQDIVDGGAGDDIVAGGGGDDVLLGWSGNDYLWGDNLQEGQTAEGAPPSTGLRGTVVFRAAPFPGNDYLDGGDGNDHLYGNMGDDVLLGGRSEERRVGKECRSRWSPYH